MTVILQVSDIHFGSEDVEALAAAEDLIRTLAPDVIAVCGDITQRGKRTEFEAAHGWLQQFEAARIVTPGNHDTPLLNLWSRINDAFDRYNAYFRRESGPLNINGDVFASLNTARGWQTRRSWAEGVVNLQALDSVLQAGDCGPPNILVCHHPFLSPPASPLSVSTRRGAQASRQLALSSVELLLTGHVHAASATVRRYGGKGYLAVSSGTLSTRLRKSRPSVNVLRLSPSHIDVTVWTLVAGGLSPRKLGRWRRANMEPSCDATVENE